MLAVLRNWKVICDKWMSISTGADRGGGGGMHWVASHPPWVCSITLIYLNKVYDEMQINHSDRALHDGGRTLTAARARRLTQSS